MGFLSDVGKAVGGATGFNALSSYITGPERYGNKLSRGYDRATQFAKEVYGEAKTNFAPYQGFGGQAVNKLSGIYFGGPNGGMDFSSLYSSPDFQAALNAGVLARDQSASARGKLFSGAHQRAINDYGQEMGTRYLDNYLNRLQNFTNTGMSANQSIANAGSQFSQTAGQNAIGSAQAQVAGSLGRDERIMGLLDLGASIFGGASGGGP